MNYSIFTNLISDMNWKEIEEKGRKNIPVLFPLGVIEEHGPHLPLGTDIYLSYAICKKIKEAVIAQAYSQELFLLTRNYEYRFNRNL